MRTHQVGAGPLVAAAVLLGWAGASLADTGTGTTTLSFSSNPVTLDFTSAPDVTVNTTTTTTAHPEEIDNGTVTIQYASDGTGPVPAGSGVSWLSLNAPGQHPVSGATSLAVDLDGIGAFEGAVIGFRAHYVTGGGSHKVSTHFSPAVDLTVNNTSACTPADFGKVLVAATLASGDGAPEPGFSGEWTFRIRTRNCTGADIASVKVQGGSNGWGHFESATASKTPAPAVKSNKRNEVITWTGALDDQEAVDIDVTLSGSIPASHPCSPDPDAPLPESIRYLSGAWSAAWNNGGPQKSDYSGRVSLVVTCPAP